MVFFRNNNHCFFFRIIILLLFFVKILKSIPLNDQHIFESIQLSNNNILLLSKTRRYIINSSFTKILVNQTNPSSIECCCDYNKIIYLSEDYFLLYNCGTIFVISKEGNIYILFHYICC